MGWEFLSDLDKFFNPKSIAIIGASSNLSKLGYYPLVHLKNYKGMIYPVTLHAEEILGYKCYKNIMDVPDKVDLAAIVLPYLAIPQALMECGPKGIKNIVIFSSGFAETNNKGLQDILVEIAKDYGMRIIGPNTNGICNFHNGVDIQLQNMSKQLIPKAGNVAFVSQSGTIGIWFMEYAAKNHVGMSKYISYGNRADVNEADIIKYLSSDPETEVIGIYIEGEIGEDFIKAVQNCKKPIVVFKSGKSSMGMSAIPNHIGCNAGNPLEQSYMLRQSKVIIPNTITEMFGIIKAFSKLPKIVPKSVGMVTNGVGPCIILADIIEKYGFESLSNDTINKLKTRLPSHMVVGKNIVDTTGTVTPEDYATTIDMFLKDSNISLIIVGIVLQNMWSEADLIKFVPLICKRSLEKPLIILTYGGDPLNWIINRFEYSGIPVYNDPAIAAEAIKALC